MCPLAYEKFFSTCLSMPGEYMEFVIIEKQKGKKRKKKIFFCVDLHTFMQVHMSRMRIRVNRLLYIRKEHMIFLCKKFFSSKKICLYAFSFFFAKGTGFLLNRNNGNKKFLLPIWWNIDSFFKFFYLFFVFIKNDKYNFIYIFIFYIFFYSRAGN